MGNEQEHMNRPTFRGELLTWYRANARALPWRETRDPYAIWISEVMLQQTRVVAVIPYYERFLTQFPDVTALAEAPEQTLLAAWAGLGYYSRARNLQKAARNIVALGGFPRTYEEIRELPGIGDYTAAAVASIAFHLPHAAVDGNVLRVLSRLLAEEGPVDAPAIRRSLAAEAQALLDTRHPGDWNQAMMELGATVCLPRNPLCLQCTVMPQCRAFELGITNRLPVKSTKPERRKFSLTVALVKKQDRLLLVQRSPSERRLPGFWELPPFEELPGITFKSAVGMFRHSITINDFEVTVVEASLPRAPKGARWVFCNELGSMALTTMTRKALQLAGISR
jgi:A/G-specific adenine glycosylase